MEEGATQANRIPAEVIKQRNASTSVGFSHTIDEWFSKADLEETTRYGHPGYIDRVIKPTLGHLAVNKLSTRDLESLYAELRRCLTRCDSKPFVEKHKSGGDHDCFKAECVHVCYPMAASTVRQIHSIISSVLNAAVRSDWIEANLVIIAKRPKQTPPQPQPPSPADAARLVDRAFELGEDWGMLVWLVMTTGMRRAEVAGLRWFNVKLDEEVIEIRTSYVEVKGKNLRRSTSS